jgi:CheY-like chemotaxis protein
VLSDCDGQAFPLSDSEVVLVVDDEPCVLNAVCLMLGHSGFRVLPAASPEAALQIAAIHHEPIDLLLSDIIMPGMSGGLLAERIALLHPETRWMFMAGMPDNPEIARLTARGMPFLPKPFYPKELVRRVRDALASQAVAGA